MNWRGYCFCCRCQHVTELWSLTYSYFYWSSSVHLSCLLRKRPFSAPPSLLSSGPRSLGSLVIFGGERCLLGPPRRLSIQRSGRMFTSVWYAKKMGRRFINNVRKAKKHRHRIMVGNDAIYFDKLQIFC